MRSMRGVPAQERFNLQYVVNKVTGCWIWTGAKGRGGYGKIYVAGRVMQAHRYALVASGKERPSAKHFALHRCDMPGCVNPEHLWWGTIKENAKDSVCKKRHREARKSCCDHGHPFSTDNTAINTRGERVCIACRRISDQKRYAKNPQRSAEAVRKWYAKRRVARVLTP